MDKNILKLTILEQRDFFDQPGKFVERRVDKSAVKSKKVTVITGVRRGGKSTLLKQIAKNYKGYYYLNFEDDRLLDFSYRDFDNLRELFLEIFGEQNVFFFDEIQNVYGWEKFVTRLFREGCKVFVTGSNARLLSSELATALSGRHRVVKLYPFSFKEFLDFNKFPVKEFYRVKERGLLKKYFHQYLKAGGFPETIKNQDKEDLRQLHQDILIKDLIVRFKIKDVKSFRELSLFLLSNTAGLISYNNLKKVLEFKSVTTVKNYVDFLEESYLNFSLFKFDYSIKKQIINDRKVFSIDTGLINAVAFSFSENYGHILENLIFLELKRRNRNVFYHKNKKECDFVIKEGRKIVGAIQVTKDLTAENKEREIDGLLEAMSAYNLKRGFIITKDEESEMHLKGKKIFIVPAYKWLLRE